MLNSVLGASASALPSVALSASAAQAVDSSEWLLDALLIVFLGKLLFWLAGLAFVALHVALLAMIAWGLSKKRFWRAGLLGCGGGLLLCYGALAFILRPALGPGASSDWAVVERGLAIDLHPQAARWEAFATPEADAWLPAPTDMETLVAELTLSPQDVARLNSAARLADGGEATRVAVAPNSARPWLTPANQALLAALAGADPQASLRAANCRGIAARGLQSHEDKAAFICIQGDQALLHVVLSGP